ncbi:MAG: phosphoadenosine phosphosulfate reductase family protein [Desulfurococcaceae archaeon]
MYNVIVRSRSDAKAFKAMISKFYPNWDINIYTLHGSREYSSAVNELENILDDKELYIIMLGREDGKLAEELVKNYSVNTVVHVVPTARLRNTRIEQLAQEFDKARSLFRLSVYWSFDLNSYLFGFVNEKPLLDYEINPAYDIFLGIGSGFNEIVKSILNSNICINPLLVRKFSGIHDVYCGLNKIAVIEIPDYGLKPSGRLLNNNCIDIDLNNLIKSNEIILKQYESISKNFLEKQREWVDSVIIPWSGGKDSTAALLLALSVFSKNIVKVLYVDTGLEFPHTIRYVEELSNKLGIDIYVKHAGIDRELLSGNKPFPTHENRWCTEIKISTVMKSIAELSSGNTLIITGDRDSESLKRSIRPPLRIVDEKTRIASPLKFWSTAHVQLYLISKNIPLNPLYDRGFYRIGCYICPSLRSWELYIMNKDPYLSNSLTKYELYNKFLKYRLENSKIYEKNESSCDVFNTCY